jgi:hypothetical protein
MYILVNLKSFVALFSLAWWIQNATLRGDGDIATPPGREAAPGGNPISKMW